MVAKVIPGIVATVKVANVGAKKLKGKVDERKVKKQETGKPLKNKNIVKTPKGKVVKATGLYLSKYRL